VNWLLLRGLGREQRHWYDFPERLVARLGANQVMLLDLAGAGTEHRRRPPASVPWLARDVARRLPLIGGERWCVLGLSLGGMVALELCRLQPERIAGAVVINSSSRLSSPFQRLRPPALSALLRIAWTRDPLARESDVLALTSRLPEPERLRLAPEGAAIASQAPVAALALLAQLLAAARFQAPERAELISPLLFLASRGDGLVNPEASRGLARRYGAMYEEHGWGGHDLPLDDPDWVCERVSGFGDTLSGVVTRG
jgi:pimeloyl-ACP methyl ester carboxylesterase